MAGALRWRSCCARAQHAAIDAGPGAVTAADPSRSGAGITRLSLVARVTVPALLPGQLFTFQMAT